MSLQAERDVGILISLVMDTPYGAQAAQILGELSDELTMEVLFGVHRRIKLGQECAECRPGCGHLGMGWAGCVGW